MNIFLFVASFASCYEAVSLMIAEKRAAIRREIEELKSISITLSDVQSAIERTGFRTRPVDNTYYDVLSNIDTLEMFEGGLDSEESYLLDQIDEVEKNVLKRIADTNKRPTNRIQLCKQLKLYSIEEFHYCTRRRPKADKYKTDWHQRKAGRRRKEAMAVWNQID